MFKDINDPFDSIHELLNDMYMKNIQGITMPSFTSNISGMKSNISDIQNDELENHKTMPTKPENNNKSIKKKIFFIEKGKKRNRKIGRICKKDKNFYYGNHNNFSKDNIIKKVKIHFVNSCFNYLNYSYKISIDDKNKTLLYKIDPEETKNTNKSASIKWFKKKLRDIFSYKLSKKCSKQKKLHNIIEIEKIFSEGKNKEMMEKLEKTVGNMYNSYINDEKIEGFKTLKDDIEELKLKQEMKANGEEKSIDNYIKEYNQIALKLEEFLSDPKERIEELFEIDE